VFLCVVLSCVGRGLGTGLIPRPRSPTKCLRNACKRHKEKEKEEEEEEEEDFNKPQTNVIMKMRGSYIYSCDYEVLLALSIVPEAFNFICHLHNCTRNRKSLCTFELSGSILCSESGCCY
jgi:hypothetical protein